MTTTGRQLIDGDTRPTTVNHYLSVSSDDRDKSDFTDSNDCSVSFDELRNVLAIELLNFELPHTKYAINSENNTLYLSEQVGDKSFNFFGLKVATSGYLVTNLAVALQLSTACPVKFSTDDNLQNSYSFAASASTGKMAVVSSGDVQYNIHTCQETLTVVNVDVTSVTEATVTFLAPFEYIVAPGAILTLSLYKQADVEVQVIANNASRVVTVLGDFAFIDVNSVDVTGATMTPVSAQNSMSEIVGFGVVDLQPGQHDRFSVLAMGSPFSNTVSGLVSSMLCVEFPAFVSVDNYVQLSGTYSYLQRSAARVSATHDDTHFELEFDATDAFEGSDMAVVSSGGDIWEIESIVAQGTADLHAIVVVTLATSTTDIVTSDILTVTGLTGDHWSSPPFITVQSVNSATQITGSVEVSAVLVEDDGSTKAIPVNSSTGYSTTYVAPNRYDLSRGRRILLCRMGIDDLDVGSISIPLSRIKFFGRIQLFSGADLVNFLGTANAKGEHRFNSLVKRLQSVRLRFYNDDGTPYNFEGVDFSMFLRVICLSSSTGI